MTGVANGKNVNSDSVLRDHERAVQGGEVDHAMDRRVQRNLERLDVLSQKVDRVERSAFVAQEQLTPDEGRAGDASLEIERPALVDHDPAIGAEHHVSGSSNDPIGWFRADVWLGPKRRGVSRIPCKSEARRAEDDEHGAQRPSRQTISPNS